MNAPDLQPHPLAEIFPLMDGPEFDALVADIAANGLREPIVLLDGQILDGRNRYRACIKAGVFPASRAYRGEAQPLAAVLSANLHRRHLNETQRAMVAAKLANMPQGFRSDRRSAKLPEVPVVSQSQAADMLNVSERSVRSAVDVQQRAHPTIVRAAERGVLPVSAAAQATKLPADQQREIARMADDGHANAVRTVLKKGVRAAREIALAQKQRALPTRRYGLILADPEWQLEVWSRETGLDRAADNHYPTSDIAAIAARDVASIAAEDCALALWGTTPLLVRQLEVMAAWGFTYKSHVIWRKNEQGNGYWFRNEHEILLIGTRGNVPCPAPGTQFPSVIDAPVGEHSAKPEKFAEMLEAYFPNLPKIELNRRGAPRSGWDAWGLEAEVQDVVD